MPIRLFISGSSTYDCLLVALQKTTSNSKSLPQTSSRGDVRKKPRHPRELPGTERGHHKSQVWPRLCRKCRRVEQRIQRFQCLYSLLEKLQVYPKWEGISCICQSRQGLQGTSVRDVREVYIFVELAWAFQISSNAFCQNNCFMVICNGSSRGLRITEKNLFRARMGTTWIGAFSA